MYGIKEGRGRTARRAAPETRSNTILANNGGGKPTPEKESSEEPQEQKTDLN